MERRAFRIPGFAMLGVLVILAVAALVAAKSLAEAAAGLVVTVLALAVIVGLTGFTVINPNEARVIQFFGRYVGTVSDAGYFWTVPLSTKRRLSRRVRNFETGRLKVSDADGNPVEIAAVVVWRVVDTFKASFGVDDHI